MVNEHLIYSAVYGIIKKGNRILLLKRFNTGYKDGFFTLPAGHIEKDELPKEAMLHELLEETGLNSNVESIVPVHVMYRICDSGRTYVDYYFEILKYEGYPENKEPEKCNLIDWYNLESTSESILPNVKKALNFIKNGVQISDIRED